MKIESPSLATFVTFAALALGACAGTTAPESSSQSAASRADASVSELLGTWTFDLEQSAVAGPLRDRCAAQANGDPAKERACWSAIASEAKQEKIRFTRVEEAVTGRGEPALARWTSFGLEGGSETVYVELPVELAPDGPSHVLARVKGEATGEHAARFDASKLDAMRIEIVDRRTIAMDDPKKGRLVYFRD